MAKKATSKSLNSTNSSVAVSTQPTGFKPTPAFATTETTKPAAKPAPVSTAKPTATRDQIAKRAYEIWIAKGRVPGKDLENWQQAERELRAR